MTSEDYREILNNEYKNKELSQDDFDNTLMHFAELYHSEKKHNGNIEKIYYSVVAEKKALKEIIKNLQKIEVYYDDLDYIGDKQVLSYSNKNYEIDIKNGTLTLDFKVSQMYESNFSESEIDAGDFMLEINDIKVENDDFGTFILLDSDYKNLVNVITNLITVK